MNQITLIGRLTKDFDLKYSEKGIAIAKCTLAVSDKTNVNQEKTDFFPLTVFGKLAETISEFTSKGNKILVQGKGDFYIYKKDEKEIKQFQVIVNRIEFLERKKSSENTFQDKEFNI